MKFRFDTTFVVYYETNAAYNNLPTAFFRAEFDDVTMNRILQTLTLKFFVRIFVVHNLMLAQSTGNLEGIYRLR